MDNFSNLKIMILGCGSSTGVPIIGCKCSVCLSDSKYNKRTQSAIIIEDNNTKILVDFGLDIRQQLLSANISYLDGAILTHAHADHCGGIDVLKIFKYIYKKPLTVFMTQITYDTIYAREKYLFDSNHLTIKIIDCYDEISVNTINIQLFNQDHGSIDSLGLRINDFVYSCDVRHFPQKSEQYLQGIKTWIVDCRDYISNNNHAGLDQVKIWNNEFKPKEIFLTNMHHTIDYHEIIHQLPKNILPSHDGLVIN